jgi:hypothetical protein
MLRFVLLCFASHRIVMWCVVWCFVVLFCILLCCFVLCCAVLCHVVLSSTLVLSRLVSSSLVSSLLCSCLRLVLFCRVLSWFILSCLLMFFLVCLSLCFYRCLPCRGSIDFSCIQAQKQSPSKMSKSPEDLLREIRKVDASCIVVCIVLTRLHYLVFCLYPECFSLCCVLSLKWWWWWWWLGLHFGCV